MECLLFSERKNGTICEYFYVIDRGKFPGKQQAQGDMCGFGFTCNLALLVCLYVWVKWLRKKEQIGKTWGDCKGFD